MSFQFVDHNVLALPIIEIADIQIHSEYKYYGNTSWREGKSPVSGTIESKDAELEVGDYKFTRIIRLSIQVKKGDSGALLISQDGRAIGIAFASVGRFGFAIPIENIINSFEIDLYFFLNFMLGYTYVCIFISYIYIYIFIYFIY